MREIRPSHLEEWLAKEEARLKKTSCHCYAGFLKQLFEVAVNDRIIAESPFPKVKTGWKKPQTPKRLIPTREQFETTVDAIRSQPFTDPANESADLAGPGQAEAAALTWGDVGWKRKRLNVRRQKTDVCFPVPIYPDLHPLLARRFKEAGRASASGPPSKTRRRRCNLRASAWASHCFSQRSLRQYLIGKLWKARVDHKLIARWQGHRDGGKLIIATHTEVFGDDDCNYERQQLAKLRPAA